MVDDAQVLKDVVVFMGLQEGDVKLVSKIILWIFCYG